MSHHLSFQKHILSTVFVLRVFPTLGEVPMGAKAFCRWCCQVDCVVPHCASVTHHFSDIQSRRCPQNQNFPNNITVVQSSSPQNILQNPNCSTEPQTDCSTDPKEHLSIMEPLNSKPSKHSNLPNNSLHTRSLRPPWCHFPPVRLIRSKLLVLCRPQECGDGNGLRRLKLSFCSFG